MTEVSEKDVRPIVARPRRTVPNWVPFAALGAFAILLFLVLESRRQALQSPAVETRAVDLSGGAPIPPLLVPPAYAPPPPSLERPEPAYRPVAERLPAVPSAPAPQLPDAAPVHPPAPYVPQPPPSPRFAEQAPPISATPVLVIDGGGTRADAVTVREGAATALEPGSPRGGEAFGGTARARAGAFANRATTVTQGTLIPAVLESALDSTRPGFARAIVSRDVRSFDGTRILIPRGSRLIGDYDSGNEAGQRRALITWTRLIRPDGATVAIDSPVADTMGRTGVRARVNTHFFERFGGAILQSILDIGVSAVSRASDNPTVIALPGSFAGIPRERVNAAQITPTLTVRPGTSVSIFVARDLDFTGVEQNRP